MDDYIEKWGKISRWVVMFNLATSLLVFSLWGLLFTRSSEFIQRGYYYYDGTMMMALVLCLIFPFMFFAYYFFRFKLVRIILIVLQFAGTGIGFAILYIYLGMIETAPNPPYIIIGQLIQDNIALILSHFLCYFLLFTINLLLLVTPFQIKVKERTKYTSSDSEETVRFTPGVAPSPVKNRNRNNEESSFEGPSERKFRMCLSVAIGGAFLVLSLFLFVVHNRGLIEFFYVVYSASIAGAIALVFSTKKIKDAGLFYEPQVPKYHFVSDVDLKMYAMFAAGTTVLVAVAMDNLAILETLPFLVVFLLILLIMGSLRLMVDWFKKPRRKSDDTALTIYKKARRGSWTFGFYSLYGGIMVLAGAYLYTLDIDRYKELMSYSKLFVCIAATFVVILFLYKWVPSIIWHIVSWLSLLSVIYLQMKTMNYAATTDWYTDPQNIIDGFPFFQSWQHAFLCSVPISTVFAIFFNHYRKYHLETQYHGVHLEVQMLFFFTMLFLGLIVGHDNRISGPHQSEFNPSAAAIYEILEIIFYVVLSLLVITIAIAFGKLYKSEKKVLMNKIMTTKTVKLTSGGNI